MDEIVKEKNNINSIILASQSQGRLKILNDMKIRARAVVSGADEVFDFALSPEKNLMNIAAAKLKKILSSGILHEDDYIISADTVVYHEGKYIGKPKDVKDAEFILRGFSGGWHRIYTGVAVYYHEMICFAEHADVKFIELRDKDISEYIKTGEPFGKAGAYAVQGIGACFIEQIKGDINVVVGLPAGRLFAESEKNLGVSVFELLTL